MATLAMIHEAARNLAGNATTVRPVNGEIAIVGGHARDVNDTAKAILSALRSVDPARHFSRVKHRGLYVVWHTDGGSRKAIIKVSLTAEEEFGHNAD